MRKSIFLFLASVCVVLCATLSSCSYNGKSKAQEECDRQVDSITRVLRADREYREAYQLRRIEPDTKVVKIYFKEGESPFFGVSVLKKDSRDVNIEFYNEDDVDINGNVKPGKFLCRIFNIFIPDGEKLDKWGYGGIDLIREDCTVHHVDFELVDQPSL